MPHKSLTNVVVRQLQNLAQALRVDLTPEALRGLEAVLQKHDPVDITAAISAIAEEERGAKHREMPPTAYILERVARAYHQRTDAPRWVPCGKCISGMRFTSADGWPIGAGDPTHQGLTECWCKRSFRRARDRWNARHHSEAA